MTVPATACSTTLKVVADSVGGTGTGISVTVTTPCAYMPAPSVACTVNVKYGCTMTERTRAKVTLPVTALMAKGTPAVTTLKVTLSPQQAVSTSEPATTPMLLPAACSSLTVNTVDDAIVGGWFTCVTNTYTVAEAVSVSVGFAGKSCTDTVSR